MMNCTHCNKPIILTPSATERAKKFGGKPSDYTAMFTMHNQCQIDKRREDTSALMRKITAQRVTYPTTIAP